MAKLWFVRAEIEVEPGDLDLEEGYTKGFISTVVWADSGEGATERLEAYFNTFKWKIISIDETQAFEQLSIVPPELDELADRAREDHASIPLGTFHSYKSADA